MKPIKPESNFKAQISPKNLNNWIETFMEITVFLMILGVDTESVVLL